MARQSVGVIGCGNMGGAILRGLAADPALRLLVHSRSRSKFEALNTSLGGQRLEWLDSPQELAAQAEIIILAVKPYQIEEMGAQIREQLGPDKIVVSVAAAVSMAQLDQAVAGLCPALRCMPNLPALVGKGAFALCLDSPALRPEQAARVQQLFEAQGLTLVLPEDKIAAFSAVAGCGPAYAFVLMEAMQNAAIALGLTAEQAKEISAATVEGSAKMALASPESFADLRVKVCSPGGMTIQAVNHLERSAVRGHISDAIVRAWEWDAKIAQSLAQDKK